MKNFLKWLEEQITWYMSPKVREAINNGATYEEVEKIVKEEVER